MVPVPGRPYAYAGPVCDCYWRRADRNQPYSAVAVLVDPPVPDHILHPPLFPTEE